MRRRSESGQTLLLLTISLIAMFGLLGLVVDIGWARFRQHAAQAAAESAALAAAEAAVESGNGGFSCGSNRIACEELRPCANPPPATPSDNLGNGCLYAAANGFRHGGRQAVRISAGNSSPSPTVPGVNVRYWVTARVSENIPQLFSAVLGGASLTAAARATAGVHVDTENACIYVLDPTARGALGIGGTTEISTGGCEIFVNSRNSSAMIVGGSAALSAGAISVSGNYEVNGGPRISPTPVTGVPPMPDPFANLPAPTFGSCNQTGLKVKASPVTLHPGVYCRGIEISQQSNVTFTPGIYILNGGGLQVSGGATLAGSGVMFYNTSRGYAFGPISISGGTNLNLSAPDSGAYKGVLFYQDRNLGNTAENDFTGNSGMNLDGTIYTPNGTLKFAGGNTSEGPFTALVARRITFTGNSRFKPDPTGERTGMARRIVSLIE